MKDLFIEGGWVPATEGGTRRITCPADDPVGTASEATDADTSIAISAARTAFASGPWPSTSTSTAQGGVLLDPATDRMEPAAESIARAESPDTGTRFVEAQYDVADALSVFRHDATIAPAASTSGRVVDVGRDDIVSTVSPSGVCVLITSWNDPLLQASRKMTPCLADGNTFAPGVIFAEKAAGLVTGPTPLTASSAPWYGHRTSSPLDPPQQPADRTVP